MRIPTCESKYIEAGRGVFAARFPDGNFDASSWDIRHLRASQHKQTNARVYFTRYAWLIENPYRVLRLSANATAMDAHRSAASLRRMAVLNVVTTTEADFPSLGPLSRTESSIRAALGRSSANFSHRRLHTVKTGVQEIFQVLARNIS
jgi:hypothetical protein